MTRATVREEPALWFVAKVSPRNTGGSLEKAAPVDVTLPCLTERNRFMGEDEAQTLALIKALADSPKRDNSVYHKAMAEARRVFEQAEHALGTSVRLKTKAKRKKNGDYVVKWTFKRAK